MYFPFFEKEIALEVSLSLAFEIEIVIELELMLALEPITLIKIVPFVGIFSASRISNGKTSRPFLSSRMK